MRPTWDRARVVASLAALRDAGVSVPRMARMARANRSTIYRWIGGEVAPDYALVHNLAYAVWRQHPDLARELVVASGYAWAEPTDVPEPEPAISADLLAAIRRTLPDDPAAQQRVIDAVERAMRGEPPPSAPRAADDTTGKRAAS